MGIEELSKEQRILRLLRKTLGNIVKDTAPRPGVPNPLSDDTVEQVKELFALISERERELADEAGFTATERPYFSDEPPTTQTIKLTKPPKKPN